MSANALFTPHSQQTVSITCGTASASVALVVTGSTSTLPRALRVKNIDATNIAYVNFGVAGVVATVPSGSVGGSVPIGAGETAGFSIGVAVTNVAAICTAGTPVVYFTVGEGL